MRSNWSALSWGTAVPDANVGDAPVGCGAGSGFIREWTSWVRGGMGVQIASSGGQQMGVLGQPRPDRLEGEQALRPRTEQQGVVVAVLAFGEVDGQPVDGSEPRLRAVEPDAQGVTP